MARLRCLLSVIVLVSLFIQVLSECKMQDDQCEFWLEISLKMTMMYGRDAVYPHKGKLYKYDVPEADTPNKNPVSTEEVIVADGWEHQRLVIVANGSMPGPPIEVFEGQKVVVHVTNKLESSGVTIHWHGLHQHDTPWMDGVAFITQCPIEPGQSFTYRFKAFPKGTFWYHSHIGSQLGMGLIGAFIIKEKKPVEMKEHIMMLQDWNHDIDADLFHMKMKYGSFENRRKIPFTTSLDGARFGHFIFHSGLINGKGRYYGETNVSNMSPLTEYQVEKGQSYRFRVVGAGSTYPFRVSIDGHYLTLVASDGYDLQPQKFESIIVQPGERFDFVIHANESVGNYWVRAESLEVKVFNHIALAILRYQGAPIDEPTSKRKTCLPNDRCMVANCPFTYYPGDSNTECVNFDVLKSNSKHGSPGVSGVKEEEIVDVFMNFGFPGAQHPASVNGVVFEKPPVPALTQPYEIPNQCTTDLHCEEQKICQCSNSLTLDHGKVYQIVMVSLGHGKGFSHPIHMHGHSFHVVKMGYPFYNKTTGAILADNPDISCRGNVTNPDDSFCNQAIWSNSSWSGNNIPGLELDSPPRKDTIIVPNGGYAVIRIKADNPGLWFMHCHMELHAVSGMALMLNESFGLYPPPPMGFPKCGNFDYSLP